jgi:glycosyltransferase involved in cell wall biosynthesis
VEKGKDFVMGRDLISCIIPVYNGERYLGEAIDSILAQTSRPLEIIVVDDGSTDGTAEVAAGYGDRLSYVRQNNAGPAAARNLGLNLAQGEFVAFLDADDLWHPEKLRRQMARFQARPELDYCVGYVQNFWIPELQAEAEKYRGHRISEPMPGYVTGTLLARCVVFEMLGLFDPALDHGDSTEWFLRAVERGAMTELLPDLLLYRRLHPNNRSRARAANSREEYLKLLKSALDRKRALD